MPKDLHHPDSEDDFTPSPAMLQALASKRHLGVMQSPDGIGEMAGDCGDSLLVQLRIKDGVIQEVRSLVRGCMYTTACATAMGDLAVNRRAEDALWLEPDMLAEHLGALPDDHLHCARLVLNALGEALASWSEKQLGIQKMGA